MPAKNTPAQKVQFLPLAKVHDKLSAATYAKRMEKQADTMSSVLSTQYRLIHKRFHTEILYGEDVSVNANGLHIEFELVQCGRVHIDLSIEGFASVRKYGGGADFLPFARPTIQFTDEYNAEQVAQWIIQAILELRESVQAYHFGTSKQNQ